MHMGLKNLRRSLKAISLRKFLTGDEKSRNGEATKRLAWMTPISHGFHVVEHQSFRGTCEDWEPDTVVVQREQIEDYEVWFFGLFDAKMGDGITKYLQSHLFDKQLNKSQISRKSKEALRRAHVYTRLKINGDKEHKTGKGSSASVIVSTLDQVATCPIPRPPEWPALLQIPAPKYRAAKTDFMSFTDLTDNSCKRAGSCPVTILLTGGNKSFGQSLAGNFFTGTLSLNSSDVLNTLANVLLGSETKTDMSYFLEPAFFSDVPTYYIQSQCSPNSTLSVPIEIGSTTVQQEVRCAEGSYLWRNSSSEINDELFKGYRQGNPGRQINEIVTAYDFLNSNEKNFNMSIWYNSTYKNDSGNRPPRLLRIPRSVNLASNAYLQFLQGADTKILLEFVKEMPKPETKLRLDFASLLGALFFAWVIIELFPVILTSLVYEKQWNLRIMMKMHGLGDGPYWLISYAYFLFISLMYMLCFVIFGSLIGLKFFTINDYGIQFVFYFIYINLQISLAFLLSSFFSNVKTATVIAHICVFGSGLLGGFLFQFFVQDTSFPRGWILVMELFPGFSLYRGLYEFAQYSFTGNYMGTDGMRWRNLDDSMNGMREVLIIMFIEWLVVLIVAYYVDQVVSLGSGVRKHPLFFFAKVWKEALATFSSP